MIRKPTLTLFYQYNPWNSSIGGIQTVVTSFIKYAPPEFDVRLVGTGVDPTVPIGKWTKASLHGREISFMPLFRLEDDNTRHLVPTSVRYTAALLKHDLSSDFMHFHRLEPSLAALRWQGHKTFFIHNDIRQKIQASPNKKATLWQRFPGVYFALEKMLVSQFDKIWSCNSESMAFYKERYPTIASRIAYIRNTVDQEVFFAVDDQAKNNLRLQLAQQMGLPESTRFLLFAGRLHPQKDPLLLVRTIAALADPSVHLLIAGEGELSDALRNEIQRLQLSKQITMLGSVPQDRLATLHQLSDAFVLTSVFEGLPLVALEALACGTPVLTTRAGETPSLLNIETGIVCDSRSPVDIAKSLRHLLDHPERYPSKACAKAAEPYYASSVICGVYNEMLQQWQSKFEHPLSLIASQL